MKKIIFCLFLFVQLGIKAQVPSYVPTNGLVGWWPFNGNANDESGNGNHGTVNGPTLTADRNGKINSAYLIQQSTNTIDFGNSQTFGLTTNQVKTFSFWFKSINNSIIFAIYKYDNGYASNSNYGILGGYNIFALTGNGTGANTESSVLESNKWVHGVFEIQAGANKTKIYINGNLVATGTSNLSNNVSTANLKVNSSSGIQNYTTGIGYFDDFIIFNRALTQQEITALYQGCTTPTATITPQSYTTICQGNSVVLNASTGTNYTYEWYKNGTLINGASTSTYSATTAGNYSVKVMDGACNATSSATTLTLIDTLTWTGNVDNDWHKPCNWSPEIVPECCNSVKIPLTTNSPVVSGVAKAKNVNVYSTSGATLTVNNGANLQIETCPVTKTENSCPTLPVLTTTVISNTTQTGAVSGGNITYTGSSNITARGICWSTATSPTIANSKTTDGSGVGSFTSNVSGLTAGTTYYVRAYATNASGTSYGNEVSFIAVNPQPAYPVGSVFCNGTPTLVVDVTNPTTGKTWMDRNLGASQVATSINDANAYGDLYQWGRGSDGHQCRNSATTTTLSTNDQPGHNIFIINTQIPGDWQVTQNSNLWQNVSGFNNPCPTGYRIPTETELVQERSSWSIQTTTGAFNSNLKIPASGYRSEQDGYLIGGGGYGYLWSSSISGYISRTLIFNSSNAYMGNNLRAVGFPLRCIKN